MLSLKDDLKDLEELLSIAKDKKKHLGRQVTKVETEIIGLKIRIQTLKDQIKKEESQHVTKD